ncbi:MAG TPA: glycogen synthase [Gammaproteobacteria bacterium]|nr:glycogen synthase [Gammaproteobacteria bacterium]
MKVLMVCSEFAPLAKTGGLADAVTGLSRALAERGHDVRVLLPRYSRLPAPSGRPLRAPGGDYSFIEAGSVEAGSVEAGSVEAGVAAAATRPRRRASSAPRVYAVDLGDLGSEGIYSGDQSDAGRFLKLSLAVEPLCAALGWKPDVVHCHDWHAALVPVALKTRVKPPPTVLTLHNIGYQGIFDADVLELYGAAALRPALAPDALAGDAVNFLRAGLRAADVVTTVSPTYAKEILTPAYGMGLEGLLSERDDDVVGILNGVDYDTWGPRVDPFIDAHYDVDRLAPKYRLKEALSLRLGLVPGQNAPLVGVVSRIVPQKGIDLVAAALPTLLLETRANFVFLGNGDASTVAELRRIAAEQPQRVSFTDAYDEPLAHQIFGGSDVFLVPSRYEPCGLTQMYALRYGTIPVVRATGGLADTITHFDPRAGTGNGSVFRDADLGGLLWGVRSAFGWFEEADVWSRLMRNAMAADFSWREQVRPYEELYRELVSARGRPTARRGVT